MRNIAVTVLALVALSCHSYGFDFRRLDPEGGLFDCTFVSDKNSTIIQHCSIHNSWYSGKKADYVAEVESFISNGKVSHVSVFVFHKEGTSFRYTGIYQSCGMEENENGVYGISCNCYEKYGSTEVNTGKIFYGMNLSSYLKSNN